MKYIKDVRTAVSIACVLVSIYLFNNDVVADAIYFLVMGVWIEPRDMEKGIKA